VDHTAEAIHQEPTFESSRQRIYNALLDSKQFGQIMQLSGAMAAMKLGDKPPVISRDVGGTFSLFGGYITGLQLELVPNARIVQAWRVGSWQPGIYSIAKFELHEQEAATKIVFDHTGFPKGMAEHLASGWNDNYWSPLRKLLALTAGESGPQK